MRAGNHKRVQRVAKVLSSLPIRPSIVRRAFAEFRESGELPSHPAVARAVIDWANSGIDASRYSDAPGGRQALLRAYLQQLAKEHDELMHALRLEAAFAEDPIRGIASIVLQRFAADGHDPSKPLFELGHIPKPVMTCSSVAMSLVKFPYRQVDEADHPRLELVLERFQRIREELDKLDDDERSDWFDKLAAAAEALDAGQTVDDLMLDALQGHRGPARPDS